MPVYARSDVDLVAIPAGSGGCGQPHARPVVNGAPAKVWKLACPQCEQEIKRDIKASTMEWIDKEKVKHTYNTSVWGDDPSRVPMTPDEEHVSQNLETQGRASMAQAFQGMAQALISEQHKQTAVETEQSVHAQAKSEAALEIEQLREQIAALQQAFGTQQPLLRPKNGNPQKAASALCPECGGPLRQPGSRGPSPKVCASCKPAKKKVPA